MKLILISILFFLLNLANADEPILFKAHEFSGWFPPDAGIAVSHSRIVSAVNGQIALFKKTKGNQQLDIKTLLAFYRTGDAFDPRAVYDNERDKLIVVVVNGRRSEASHLEFAISANGNINNLNGDEWNFTSIKVPEDGMWLDYPMIGIDSYNIYITGNMFTDIQNLGNYGRLYIIKKDVLYGNTGGLLSKDKYYYYNIRDLPYTSSSMANAFRPSYYSIQPTWNWSNSSVLTRNFLIARSNTELYLIEISNLDSIDGDFRFFYYKLPIPLTSAILNNAPQNGTDKYLVETNDVRLCEAMSIDGKLVISQTVRNMSSGVCMARVYQVDISEKIPKLISIDEITGNSTWYYFSAVAINEKGTMNVMAIRSSANEYISMSIAHKKVDDISFSEPQRIAKGDIWYGRSRYGDYSSVALDPTDKLRFWYLGELPQTETRWDAWIYSDCPDCSEIDCGPHGTWKDGVCVCALGWNGTQCNICAQGYWGPECQPCPQCLNGGICVNGTCICKNDDFFGNLCQHTCKPHGMYHQGICWCSAGYMGTYCNDCRYKRRDDGTCMICPDDCSGNGKCNEANGVCNCFEHFSGRNCSLCAEGWKGINCNESIVVDCINGEVIGNRCICLDGWDGPDCSIYVGKCFNGVIKNGTCICSIGWAGKECNTCASEFWGSNCENMCPWCNLHGTCNTQGQCECSYGWQDGRCQTCSWWYKLISKGKECECGNCGPYGRCNITTGECDCFEGWSGLYCSQCLDTSSLSCGYPNGKCVDNKCICKEGWYGWNCEANE